MDKVIEYLQDNLYIGNLLSGTRIAIRDIAIENLIDYFKYDIENIYKISNLKEPGVAEDLANGNMEVLEFKED